MALNSMEKEWSRFANMIFDGTEPDVQVKEMKKAFFAGAWAMWTAMEEIGEPHITERQAEFYLIDTGEEIREFARSIVREYGEMN